MGVCCPDDKDQQSSFADDSVLESSGERTSGEKKDAKKSTSKATACLLTNSQKQKIDNSRCTTRNAREKNVEKSNQFIAQNIMPWAGAAQYPQTFLTRHWIKKRAIDLGINRIVGGSAINPHQFKFVAALLTEDYQGRVRQFCGGSVIDEYHILTAAHCVASYTEDDVRRLRVHLGVHNIQSTPTKSVHRVDRIIRHINFSQRTLDNDVAILTLNTPAPIGTNPNVKQACLPSGNSLFEERSAIVAGWGSLKFGGHQPKELYSVNVKVWNNHNCHANYGAQAPGGITSRMLCASLPGQDSCQGDSGGALFTCTSSSDCTQIGIVSWGIGCAESQYPGVYTRVTQMMDWIQRITSCY
jgi:secreted trypsin-like serine protease